MLKRLCLYCLLPLFFTSCSWMKFWEKSMEYDDIQPEYESLFDGKSLRHWVVMGNPEGFQVLDGVIRSEGGQSGDWLRSEKQYGDFVLQLEYRLSPEGNSGVFFRCQEDGQPWETGFECQLSNEQPPRDELHCTGSLYGLVPVQQRPDESPEVWHQCKIICKQERVIIFIDGVQTVNARMDTHDAIHNKPMKGYIGLQDSHTEEGKWVEFRNIQIREW